MFFIQFSVYNGLLAFNENIIFSWRLNFNQIFYTLF